VLENNVFSSFARALAVDEYGTVGGMITGNRRTR
jgi:hypothetical protein